MNHSANLSFLIIPCPKDFDVCWVGQSPFPKAPLGFGSTDGQLIYADTEGNKVAEGKGSASNEAINGMAREGMWVGISTRQEINLSPLDGTAGIVIPNGAHGITTAGGCFLAPAGQDGIVVVEPPFGPEARAKEYSNEELAYVYSITVLPGSTGRGVLACAARRGGIVAGEFTPGLDTFSLKTATFANLDIIDICPLNAGGGRGAVALGRDGSVVGSSDLLDANQKFTTMKFKTVEGVAYRVFSSGEDIYVLTSKGLYVIAGLVHRFLHHLPGTNWILPVPINSPVEANVVADRWLLVAIPGKVVRFDLAEVHQHVLEGPPNQSSELPEPEDHEVVWKDVLVGH